MKDQLLVRSAIGVAIVRLSHSQQHSHDIPISPTQRVRVSGKKKNDLLKKKERKKIKGTERERISSFRREREGKKEKQKVLSLFAIVVLCVLFILMDACLSLLCCPSSACDCGWLGVWIFNVVVTVMINLL